MSAAPPLPAMPSPKKRSLGVCDDEQKAAKVYDQAAARVEPRPAAAARLALTTEEYWKQIKAPRLKAEKRVDAITGKTSLDIRLCRAKHGHGVDNFPPRVQQDLELRGFSPLCQTMMFCYRRNGLEELSLEVLRDYHEQIVAADLKIFPEGQNLEMSAGQEGKEEEDEEQKQAKKQAAAAERPPTNNGMWRWCNVDNAACALLCFMVMLFCFDGIFLVAKSHTTTSPLRSVLEHNHLAPPQPTFVPSFSSSISSPPLSSSTSEDWSSPVTSESCAEEPASH